VCVCVCVLSLLPPRYTDILLIHASQILSKFWEKFLIVSAEFCIGRFIMFSVITNIYNKKSKGPTLVELFPVTGKLKKVFLTTRDVRCVHHGCCNDVCLKARIIKHWRISMHPCRSMCGKNLNILSKCAVPPVVHTSNISSCQKTFSVFLWLWTIPLR
jgi:hypothetical protein